MLGCNFFFYELVWVQIGPKPDLFPLETPGRLEGIRLLGSTFQLVGAGLGLETCGEIRVCRQHFPHPESHDRLHFLLGNIPPAPGFPYAQAKSFYSVESIQGKNPQEFGGRLWKLSFSRQLQIISSSKLNV